MARTPSIQRGSVQNVGPPATTVKLSGANFVVPGATHDHSWVWWQWHRQSQVLAIPATTTWGGIMGFCIVATGDTVPDPVANPNDPRWLEWFPLTPQYGTEPQIWYDSGTPATREWNFPGTLVELKTRRKIGASGAALWWSWNLGFSPGSADRISLAWETVQLLP